MAISFLLNGIGVFCLGLADNFWIYLSIVAMIGITMPFFNTPFMVLMQTTVDPTYMGRVFSVVSMISSIMMPVGMLVFGPLADKVAIDVLLIETGIALVLLTIPFVTNKTLHKIGESHL
jgi:DHA3 family macrolide efflux protein-like MFS transporter